MDFVKNFGLLGVAGILAAAGVYFGSTGNPEYAGYDLMAFLLAALAFCAQVVSTNHRTGTLVTALLAAGCNAYLFYRKFETTGESACNVSQTLNCDIVNQSAASELFGLPVTLYGMAFYVGLALASFGSDEKAPRFNQINGLFALASLAFSAYLGWEAKKLGAFCVLCITIYACNGLLLWAALRGLKSQAIGLFEDVDKVFGASSLWVITGSFAVITLVGASSWRSLEAESAPTASLKKPAQPDGSFSAEQLATLYARPRGAVKLDGTEPVFGDRSAPITVVEFADYGCPHCAQAAPVLKELVHEIPTLQLRFKAFPLSGACNPALEGEDGPERCKAAMAAECAGQQGRYFDMSGKMFQNLGYNSDNDLAFMAQEVGLDFAAWESCMGQQSTVEAVVADAVAGFEAGVQGTPTLYVRGLVDGVEWVEITKGPEVLRILVEAKGDGVQLLPPQ
ncbi:MAG: thioredoxin domain-containing protein [Myxococcota bacterium]